MWLLLDDPFLEQGGDEAVAVICYDGFRVAVQGFLEVLGDLFGKFFEFARKGRVPFPPFSNYLLVSFKVFESRPPGRVRIREKADRPDLRFHFVENGIDIGSVRNVERLPDRTLLPQLRGGLEQLIFTPARARNRGDNRQPQPAPEFLGIYFKSPRGCHIDHVQGYQDRNAEFKELDRQVEISLEIG